MTVTSTVTANQTVSSTLVLGTGAAATFSFINQSTAAGNVLTLGALHGGTGGTPGSITLNFADSGNIAVAGPIANGGAAAVSVMQSGAGVLTLAAANSYTGSTMVLGGTLNIAADGSLLGAGNVNVTGGGVLTISGKLGMANGTAFGVGSGVSATTGTVDVNSGGALNIGNGGGLVFIGGDYVNAAGTGPQRAVRHRHAHDQRRDRRRRRRQHDRLERTRRP